MSAASDLENRPEGGSVTIYPHTGVALLQIARVWAGVTIATGAVLLAENHLPIKIPPEVREMIRFGLIALWGGAVLYAAQRFLHYSNTYIEFTDEAVVYRRGWIPHYSDTIFWVNIKDINSSSSVGESMLGAGTIVLAVAIRTELNQVSVPYLPDHERIAEYIRQKIGEFGQGTRQVTYT